MTSAFGDVVAVPCGDFDDDFTGLLDQRRQDLERLIFQLDTDTVLAKLSRVQPNFKNAESDLITFDRHSAEDYKAMVERCKAIDFLWDRNA